MLKTIHLWVGVVGVIVFLLTGQYFSVVLDGLQGMEDTPRLLLRSSHVYLFFASFVNVLFGLYFTAPKPLRWYTLYNQCFILLSPLLLAYGFFCEAFGNPGIERPLSTLGVVFLFIWLVNTLLGKLIVRYWPDRFVTSSSVKTSVD